MTTGGVIERYAAAWQEMDLQTMFDLYGPDVVVHYGGSSPFAGDHHGRDALIGLLMDTASRSARRLVSVDAVFDEGDRGAIFATEAFAIGSGEDATEVTVERCLRYRVADGLIAELWLYDRDQHLVDQAWS